MTLTKRVEKYTHLITPDEYPGVYLETVYQGEVPLFSDIRSESNGKKRREACVLTTVLVDRDYTVESTGVDGKRCFYSGNQTRHKEADVVEKHLLLCADLEKCADLVVPKIPYDAHYWLVFLDKKTEGGAEFYELMTPLRFPSELFPGGCKFNDAVLTEQDVLQIVSRSYPNEKSRGVSFCRTLDGKVVRSERTHENHIPLPLIHTSVIYGVLKDIVRKQNDFFRSQAIFESWPERYRRDLLVNDRVF